MNFLELAAQRCSVRNFDARPVEEEKLRLILEAGRLAPTAVNKQPQRIFVLKSEEAITKLRGLTRMAFNAPVALLVCYDKRESWKAANYGDEFDAGEMDATIVTTHMMLQAAELGLGMLWARGFHAQALSDAFGLDENLEIACLLDVGYPAQGYECPPWHNQRRPLEDTVKEL